VGLTYNGTMYYVHTDHLGRPAIVADSAKAVVWMADNLAFDRDVLTNTIGGLNLGFPGQYYDSEKGSWYNYFRDYDANTGRYIQSDPIGLAGGMNTYGYAGGNPLNLVDPTGSNWVVTAAVGGCLVADIIYTMSDIKAATTAVDQLANGDPSNHSDGADSESQCPDKDSNSSNPVPTDNLPQSMQGLDDAFRTLGPQASGVMRGLARAVICGSIIVPAARIYSFLSGL